MPINANKIPVELLEKVFYDFKGKHISTLGGLWEIISVNPKNKTLSLQLICIDEPVKEK